jgi:hypothetical protein
VRASLVGGLVDRLLYMVIAIFETMPQSFVIITRLRKRSTDGDAVNKNRIYYYLVQGPP